MALTFATRYRTWPVLAGTTIATAVVHLISVGVGYGLGAPLPTGSLAFFLAELGDKTMLATITLATQYGWLGVWVGSTLGMVVADAFAIVVGRQLGRRLPERTITVGAAGLFFVFGAWLAVEATEQLTGRSAWSAVAAVLNHHLAGWIALGLGVVAIVVGAVGRRWARAGDTRTQVARGCGTPAWSAAAGRRWSRPACTRASATPRSPAWRPPPPACS